MTDDIKTTSDPSAAPFHKERSHPRGPASRGGGGGRGHFPGSRFGNNSPRQGGDAASGSRARHVLVERKVRRTFVREENLDPLDAALHSLDSTIIHGHSEEDVNKLTRNERQARLEALEQHKEELIQRQKKQQEKAIQRESLASAQAGQQAEGTLAALEEEKGKEETFFETDSSGDLSSSVKKGGLQKTETGAAKKFGKKKDGPHADIAPKRDLHATRNSLMEPKRQTHTRVHIERLLTGDDDRQHSLASARRRIEREKKKHAANREETPRLKTAREVNIPDIITIQELANRMSERAADVIRSLMQQGIIVKITDTIDADTAQLIAEEFGHIAKRVSETMIEEGLISEDDSAESKLPRPPIVTVMGHVDHGKTSLLDALRQTDVAASEMGGITQHIGAYQVTLSSGQKITFLDTPGHEAFTAMRARGAKLTDIVVLVVAADDGVMPQTVEAIGHTKAAGVPMIVAINKIDKPNADPERVKQELLKHGVVSEEYGGDVLMLPISAKNKIGLSELEEMILLQSEILNLRANPNRTAEGTIIEGHLDKGYGPVGTVLIQRGVIKVGNIALTGCVFGRIRVLLNDKGISVKEAGPSMPVAVIGLSGTPEVGDVLVVVENEARARSVTEYRTKLRNKQRLPLRTNLEQTTSNLAAASGTGQKFLSAVVKADVRGSAEAITQALEKIGTPDIGVRVVYTGVGAITDSDVHLASVSKAPIISFNVRTPTKTKELAKQHGVDIRFYSLIYDLIKDIKSILSGMLAPRIKEIPLGFAEVLDVFSITRVGKIAGCAVKEGSIAHQAHARLVRDGAILYQGKIGSLRRFKEDVKTVKEGLECGISIDHYQNVVKGDIIECFNIEEIRDVIE